MGKASSSKKVARAARAGGRSAANKQRNLLFPGVIGGIMLLGVALVAFAANDRKAEDDVPPVLGDHWHAAVGFYICGEFQPNLPEFESRVGIHTHGDGVIHIHPSSAGGAGENATLGAFLEGAGVTLDDNELNALLLNSALENSALYVNAGAPPLQGSGLEMLARKYNEVQAIIKRWARRYDDRRLSASQCW